MVDDESWRRLEQVLAELTDRVARLEERSERGATRAGADQADDLWALTGLQQRVGEDGGVVYAGSVRLASGERYVWQEGYPAAHLRGLDWGVASETLAALGHPVRLALLRALFDGAGTVKELCELPGLGTAGQVYHHLREIQAAGWVRQERRNAYRIPPERIVPLLVVLTAATGRRTDQGDEEKGRT